MADLNTLIEKYWSGELNPAEKHLLIEMLEEKVTDFSDEEYKAFAGLINEQATDNNKKDLRLHKVLHAIEDRLGFSKEQAPVRSIGAKTKWRWLVAASIIGILFSGTWVWISNDRQNLSNNNPISAIDKSEPAVDTIVNVSKATVSRTLTDGTIVYLEPNSALSFYQSFGKSKRDISLKGKATFHVAKDKEKPFTVYANGVATTAIGTVFTVDALSNEQIDIRLLEGKVVVTSADPRIIMNLVYLLPGEELKYNRTELAYTKTTFNTPDNKFSKGGGDNKASKVALAFNKTPLHEVFALIEKKYKVDIKYNKDELDNLSFTGSFLTSDSLKNILTILCSTNDLTLKSNKNTIVITR